MRTTIEVDEGILNEAVNVSQADSKKDVIEGALREFVRCYRLAELRSMIGTHDINMTPDELRQLRGCDQAHLPN